MLRYCFVFFILLLNLFSKDLTPVSLQLTWKYQFQFAGYIMAKEKGFYKDVGLDVDLREYKLNHLPKDEVAKKTANFGVGRSDLILDRLNKDIDYLLMFALCQASPVTLQSIKENGITTINDLKGKKFLSYKIEDLAPFKSMLHSVGISQDDFVIVEAKRYGLDQIVDGTADLVIGYSTITPYHLKKMGYTPVSFHPKDYGFDSYGDILFTTETFAQKYPKIVKNFYDASMRGWKYAFANIDETIKIIKTKYDTQKLPVDLLKFEADQYKKLAFFDGVPFGDINSVKLEKIVNTFKLLKETKSVKNNFDDFIYHKKQSNHLNLTSAQIEFIKQHPIIRVGIQSDDKPISFIDKSGLHKGISHDIFELVSQQTGLRFIYSKVKENQLFKQINKKYIDLTITSKDSPIVDMTEPVLIIQKENNNINLRFALHKQSYILKSILNKMVNKITPEQKEFIKNRWIPKIKKEFDWILIWQILSVSGVIIIIILYSQDKKLSKEVDRKTKDLKIALDEKALLFKELNHRVKNNMQTIVSLIRLQSDRLDDPKLQDILTTIQNRINAMGHLHELLDNQENQKYINTDDYFTFLIDELKDSYESDVTIDANIDVKLDITQAIYCGIIVNEIITNALKYAFEDKDDGHINISLVKYEDKFHLKIYDNGIGYSQDKPSNSLGLKLVQRLVEKQLDGTININSKDGVKIDIQWVVSKDEH